MPGLRTLQWPTDRPIFLGIKSRHDMMSQSDCSECWEIHFSGQVQGVGFRYTTRRLAWRFPLCGYVKNLSDGRVELVIEGDPKVLRQLVSLIETEMSGSIIQTQITQGKARGEFTSFEIAY